MAVVAIVSAEYFEILTVKGLDSIEDQALQSNIYVVKYENYSNR